MFGFTKQITAVLASIFIVGLAFASPAAAENGPVLLPGGNGPTDPIVINPDLVIAPLFPSASVVASCTSETATVTVKNPSNSAYAMTVLVDGVEIATPVVSANQQYKKTFPLAENATKAVKVDRANITMLDTDVKRDCLKPEPSYDILTNCETGQAHARLINNGDDIAMMAVQYGEGPYAHESVATHSSKDWLLSVAPGESVSFKVVHSSTVLGSETLDFECADPEPEPQPGPQPQPEPKPEPVTPTPNAGTDTDAGSAGGATDEADSPTADQDSATDADVAGVAEDLPAVEISDIDATNNGDELLGEVAGSTLAVVEPESEMGNMKIALITIWILVIGAAGTIGVLVNRRRSQES